MLTSLRRSDSLSAAGKPLHFGRGTPRLRGHKWAREIATNAWCAPGRWHCIVLYCILLYCIWHMVVREFRVPGEGGSGPSPAIGVVGECRRRGGRNCCRGDKFCIYSCCSYYMQCRGWVDVDEVRQRAVSKLVFMHQLRSVLGGNVRKLCSFLLQP